MKKIILALILLTGCVPSNEKIEEKSIVESEREKILEKSKKMTPEERIIYAGSIVKKSNKLNTEDLSDAYEIVRDIDEFENEDIYVLKQYIKYLMSPDPIERKKALLLAKVRPEYDGFLKEEVSAAVLKKDSEQSTWKNITIDDWKNKQDEIVSEYIGDYAVDLLREEKESLSKKIRETQVQKQLSTSPKIGMTATEVLMTGWGKPIKVNKTITKYDTKEQWVYGEGKYVYFRNGIVETIQY